jgi:transcriptional/translational regulatory protein YebC/TACO1
MDAMLEAGEDIKSFELVGDQIEVLVDPSSLAAVKESLQNQGLTKCTKAEIVYVA